MFMITLYAEQKKRHRFIEQSLGVPLEVTVRQLVGMDSSEGSFFRVSDM